MSDTHINAFFADVDEAEKNVLAAHAEWEAAKARLEVKKQEVGYEEPQKDETPKPKNNSLFGKKQ